MFQHTSETIINSAVGALAGGTKRWDVINDVLIIDGVTAVKLADIKAIYHAPYAAASKAKAEITLTGLTAGDTVRLRVYLTEQGRSSSIMQNAYLHKQKPFTFEVIAPAAVTGASPVTVEEGTAALLAKAIKKELAETDFKFFSASVDNTTKSKLVFEAADEYLRFTNATGVVVPVGGAAIEAGVVTLNSTMPLSGWEMFDVKATGTVTVAGSQGAGTVKRLIKDLRVPTSAKSDPLELKDGGMPIPAGQYDQYLIEVVTDRRHIAGGVVGSINQSLTSYVLFIESAAKTAASIGWTAAILTSANLAKMNCGNGITVQEAGPQNSRADVSVDGTSGEVTFG